MAQVTKIRIIPVSTDSEANWITNEILKFIGAARKLLDDAGKNYEHDVPWNDNYLQQPKQYLSRVMIGAIGRINNCESAVKLGLYAKIPARSRHFTSMGLYYVYRMARQRRRDLLYAKKLEVWLNTYLSNKNSPHLFSNYSRKGFYGS